MKYVYPVILTPAKIGYVVSIPDLGINTQGHNVSEAINMARDAIGIWGIAEQDAGRTVPKPSKPAVDHKPDEIATLIDIDFDAYRRAISFFCFS